MAGDVGKQRLEDLLIARATGGLDAAEAEELQRLLVADPDADDCAYERAAAAVCLAVLGVRPALPRNLRARLERSAAELVQPPAAGD